MVVVPGMAEPDPLLMLIDRSVVSGLGVFVAGWGGRMEPDRGDDPPGRVGCRRTVGEGREGYGRFWLARAAGRGRCHPGNHRRRYPISSGLVPRLISSPSVSPSLSLSGLSGLVCQVWTSMPSSKTIAVAIRVVRVAASQQLLAVVQPVVVAIQRQPGGGGCRSLEGGEIGAYQRGGGLRAHRRCGLSGLRDRGAPGLSGAVGLAERESHLVQEDT